MNPILLYEQGYIPFSELADALWDFSPERIFEIGEKCFSFYCDKANQFHEYNFYILTYGSGLNGDEEWYCE